MGLVVVASAMAGFSLARPPSPAARSALFMSGSRREVLQAGTAALLVPSFASAASPPVLGASWSATDGFSDKGFISFNEDAYKSMRDDEGRTPLFEKAIKARLAGQEGMIVLDLGTGPFALLALIAARAGARKVYAIEAQPEAARRAREVVRQAGFADVIQVIEGFSTSVQLPEKADLALAEIIGSVASEEGLYGTVRDAHARLLKRPETASSWIPSRCQTLAAPASYALHYSLGPPQFDWGKLKEPLRLNCRDETLQLLAEPRLLEDIDFTDIAALPAPGSTWRAAPPPFAISAARLEANEQTYLAELKREGATDAEARSLSAAVARSMSGLAMWPRLVLDADTVVESRGPNGEHRKSHWQTVLPLLSARPQPVAPGDTLVIRAAAEVQKVEAPLKYTLEGQLQKA